MTRQARRFGRTGLLRMLSNMAQYESQVSITQFPRVLLEIMSLELAEGRTDHGHAVAAPNSVVPAAPKRPIAGDALWSELRLRTNEHRPLLAGFLDLATPLSFVDDTLTVSVPVKHRSAVEKLKENSQQLNGTLSQIAGRPTELAIRVTRKTGPDPAKEMVNRILGEVDEERAQ